MFNITYSRQTEKFLKKSGRILAKRLIEKIEELRETPITHDTKKIEGSEGLFRVRVGDYRILYEIDYKNNLVGIVKIDKRERVY